MIESWRRFLFSESGDSEPGGGDGERGGGEIGLRVERERLVATVAMVVILKVLSMDESDSFDDVPD